MRTTQRSQIREAIRSANIAHQKVPEYYFAWWHRNRIKHMINDRINKLKKRKCLKRKFPHNKDTRGGNQLVLSEGQLAALLSNVHASVLKNDAISEESYKSIMFILERVYKELNVC